MTYAGRQYSIQTIIAALFICLAVCSCASDTNERAIGGSGGKVITMDALQASLPTNKIIAGFDIDDTVLFSTPGFLYGSSNTDGPGGTNKYGTDFENNPQFWMDMNQVFDKFSVPKESGGAVLSLHNFRGDSIVFITKRHCYNDDAQVVQNRLNTVFQLTGSSVICTNGESKTPFIEQNNIDIYYGDSDSDIKYSLDVRAKRVRPVRILRSELSENKPRSASGYNPGKFGEEILLNSEN